MRNRIGRCMHGRYHINGDADSFRHAENACALIGHGGVPSKATCGAPHMRDDISTRST